MRIALGNRRKSCHLGNGLTRDISAHRRKQGGETIWEGVLLSSLESKNTGGERCSSDMQDSVALILQKRVLLLMTLVTAWTGCTVRLPVEGRYSSRLSSTPNRRKCQGDKTQDFWGVWNPHPSPPGRSHQLQGLIYFYPNENYLMRTILQLFCFNYCISVKWFQ